MKKQLNALTGITILKRNTKLEAEGIYLLSSESVAMNNYFHTKRDIIRAHKLMNKHLLKGMKILDYLFTCEGWLIVVQIESSERILKSMKSSEYKSKKIKSAIRRREISTILSELIRYVISGFARISNMVNRRLGSLVRSNFSRYVFMSVLSIEKVMKKMKLEQLMLCHQRKRYRVTMKMDKSIVSCIDKGDVFLCSRNRVEVIGVGGFVDDLMQIYVTSKRVLRELVDATILTHFHPSSSNIHQKPS